MTASSKEKIPLLVMGALGIVYGDIGTSPLYALKSCFSLGNLPATAPNILGLTSLFFWTLILIVSIKYVLFVLRVEEHGEGGILVLSSICSHIKEKWVKGFSLLMGLLGSALLFGDGVITPAISVLSALEGLTLLSPAIAPEVTILSVTLLILLFVVQKHGSGKLGAYFGPIMTLWFFTLAFLGVLSILKTPSILLAISPTHALSFLVGGGLPALIAMGGTIMVVTGAEALYADLGHFGARPIRVSWHSVVFPALALNYLGQGALLLRDASALANPFYQLAPSWCLVPLVVLSTLATLIASQSIISGVFSLTWQAIMLGDLPRLRVIHTSHAQRGQVYVPAVNILLCVMTMSAVLLFQTSEGLAAAYGFSVAGAMLATTLMLCCVAHFKWHWSVLKVLLTLAPLVLLDVFFFALNLSKFLHGAWYALLLSAATFTIMKSWQKGTQTLERQRPYAHEALSQFLEEHLDLFPTRLPGTAVYMTRTPDQTPSSLRINLKHNKFLHEKVLFISIITTREPRISLSDKFTAQEILPNIYTVSAFYGFKEIPDLQKILQWLTEKDLLDCHYDASFFLTRGVPILSSRSASHTFMNKLYMFLSRNALSAHEFYKIPYQQLVEIGIRYHL
ncbi:MAG: potassium transporter Kup [Alphaproteobacteria bacterium]|jgi:KUP system potassium uptake protein|nr:KUP/HAK/KT family potassium transporter [Alphaproteobacteria bacterium]